MKSEHEKLSSSPNKTVQIMLRCPRTQGNETLRNVTRLRKIGLLRKKSTFVVKSTINRGHAIHLWLVFPKSICINVYLTISKESISSPGACVTHRRSAPAREAIIDFPRELEKETAADAPGT